MITFVVETGKFAENTRFFLEDQVTGVSNHPVCLNRDEIQPLFVLADYSFNSLRKTARVKLLLESGWVEANWPNPCDLQIVSILGGTYKGEGTPFQQAFARPAEFSLSDDRTLIICNISGMEIPREYLVGDSYEFLWKKLDKARKERELEEFYRPEIYRDTNGLRRVNIGGNSYALEVPTGETNQNNVGAAHHGYTSSHRTLHAWLQAAKEVGIPARYSWTGIANSLGHHGAENPPWKPRPKDWQRAEA